LKQSLKSYNTFAVDSYTSNLSIIHQRPDIVKLLQEDGFNPDSSLFIGAGSNILLLDNAPEHVIAMRMQGIEYQQKLNGDIEVIVAAGVHWHHLVQDTLSKGINGLENLALIPGLTGAAPIQNIGAYGIEQCDRFLYLTAINMLTGDEKIFDKDECQFAYRDSFFKHGDGKHYLIISVCYLLTTNQSTSIDYKALNDAFSGQSAITSNMVFDKVCEIRRGKLPDPLELGNAGSFFKNPVVSAKKYSDLKKQFPDLIAYEQADNLWKLAAGWMIQKAGLKGYRSGNVGVHVEQALVLVNYSRHDTRGSEIVALARYVQDKVQQVFSVTLEPEVTIIGNHGVVDLWTDN